MNNIQPKFGGGAVVISVNKNADPGIKSLGAQVLADGNAVAQALLDADRCGFTPERVKALSGDAASYGRILDAIDKMADVLEEKDPFLCFFSGHGGLADEGALLVPYDANLSTQEGFLTSDAFSKSLRKVRSKRKLIIIDACHSGGFSLTGGVSKGLKPLSSDSLEGLSAGEGLVVIASSRSNEISWLLPGDSVSLFTKHLVAGLFGGGGHDQDGYVCVFDLFSFVSVNVKREEPNQTPVYAAFHQDSNFPVAYCGSVEKRVSLDVPSSDMDLGEALLEVMCELYPLGPTDQHIWERAGGDLARVNLSGNGRGAWFKAVKDITQGASVSAEQIVSAAYEDYPHNRKLKRLMDL